MLKKTIRRLGALAMVLAMAVSVFAVNASAVEDSSGETESATTSNVVLDKIYKNGDKDVTDIAPDEEITFSLVDNGYSVEDSNKTYTAATFPKNITVKKALGDSKIRVTLPTYDSDAIGTFTYTLTENNMGTAGVTYNTNTITVVVQRTWAGEKASDGVNTTYLIYTGSKENKAYQFVNTYESGSLIVTKKVTGKLGNKGATFHVTVTFTSDKVVRNNITKNGETVIAPTAWVYNETNSKYEATTSPFEVTDNTTIQLDNIPYNVSYSVAETEAGQNGYETTITDQGIGTIAAASKTVTIENNKEATTPGGVIMTIAPYALMVVLAGAFAVVFLTRRNRAE